MSCAKQGSENAEQGWKTGNVDLTIICQKPKLRPYIDQMRETLAEHLQIECERVSVKATTTEKLGFEGCEEGISAQAVCLLQRA